MAIFVHSKCHYFDTLSERQVCHSAKQPISPGITSQNIILTHSYIKIAHNFYYIFKTFKIGAIFLQTLENMQMTQVLQILTNRHFSQY